MRDAYIVAYGRSAAGKAKMVRWLMKDQMRWPQVLKGVLERVGGSFEPSMVEDVIVGNSFPEGL